MKTLHQLKTKVRKEFDREFKDFFGIKEDFLIMCDMDPKDIRDFLDTQIEKAYQTAIEDVEKIVPKKDNRNFGIIGNDPNQWHRIGKKLAWNYCIDTITSGIKKLKINNY